MAGEHDLKMDIKMNHICFPDIRKLSLGEGADEGQILRVLDYIDSRYDCADFRMVCILRSLFDFHGLISQDTLARMKKTVLGFKYWMDEPGRDSMCYWSENHQLLFAACEYLAGQLYPGETFTNNGMSGAQHQAKARERLDIWFETRYALGFTEWHSNTYYEEDIAPLSLLIDCCDQPDIVQKAAMALDLLLLDMALHSHQGLFCAASGRCYEAQKKDPFRQDVLGIAEKVFGFGNLAEPDYTRLSADFLLNRRYRMPPVIRAIAHCRDPFIVRDSMGLSLSEVDGYFNDQKDALRRGMYLWSMEAFTNPESINQTLDIFRAWDLRHNDFLKNLNVINRPFLQRLGLMPAVVRLLNPVTQGIAIQRANTYTYRTADYMLSTAQQHHPGEFGDQQHIWQATLSGGVPVFTTHPGAAFFSDNARNFSPGYWVGNGIHPHAAQHENVALCLYDLRVRKGLLEKKRQWFTHAWFPAGRMDEWTLREDGRLITARKGDAYIALLSLHPMQWGNEPGELIQRGRVSAWAAVLGRRESDGGYPAFARRAAALRLGLAGRTLTLEDGRRHYALGYRKGFWVDGKRQETDYPRLDCPFGKAPRQSGEYTLRYAGHSLHLKWNGLIREVDQP